MKKLLILCITSIILSYSFTIWGEDKIEAPELSVGNTWTFQTSSGGNLRFEVVQITEEGYVIKVGETSLIYDKNNLNLKFTIDGTKKQKMESVGRKIFDFPLFVGKRWEYTSSFPSSRTGQRLLVTTVYQVETIEDARTPAGTFKAFRILAKFFPAGHERKEYWFKYWFSPEVKFWVKREIGKSIVSRDEDAVLVSYKLEKR